MEYRSSQRNQKIRAAIDISFGSRFCENLKINKEKTKKVENYRYFIENNNYELIFVVNFIQNECIFPNLYL